MILRHIASLFVFLLCYSETAFAQTDYPARTLTDNKGRTIDVVLLSAESTTVKVRRKSDGREFNLPLLTLSKSDQDFIANWAKNVAGANSKDVPKDEIADAVPDAAKHGTPTMIYIEPAKDVNAGILPVTDWLNRGTGLSGVYVDEHLKRVSVPLWRTAEADLAVFQYDDVGVQHLATWKGYGHCLLANKGKVLCLTNSGEAVCWDGRNALKPICLQKEKDLLPPNRLGVQSAQVGEYCITVAGHLLTVIHISDKPDGKFKLVSQIQISPVDSIHVSGERLYMASQSLGKYTVQIYDIKRIEKPVKLFQWEFDSSCYELKNMAGGAAVTSLQGGRFLLVTSTRSEQNIYVFDVSQPKKPQQLANYSPKEYYGGSIVSVSDNTVIMAEIKGRFQSHKMNEEGLLEPLSEKAYAPHAWHYAATSMTQAGSRVFATGWDTNLFVLDTEDLGKITVESVHDFHAQSPDFLFDGKTFITQGSESGVSQLHAINSTTGRLEQPFAVVRGVLLALDANRVLTSSHNHLILQTIKDQSLQECSKIPESGAREAEMHGSYLRLTNRSGACVVYDISDTMNPKKVGEMKLPELERHSFSGVHNRDLALFSHFVAIRAQEALNIYDMKNLTPEPVLTLPAGGPLGHAGDLLCYASDEGVNVITVEAEKLEHNLYKKIKIHGDWPVNSGNKVNSDGKHIVVWVGEVASVFEFVPDPSGIYGIRKLGESLMPRCECHGGWYGAVKDGFFITADAFAGVSIMKIRASNDTKSAAVIKRAK